MRPSSRSPSRSSFWNPGTSALPMTSAPIRQNSGVSSESTVSWKARYAALKSRLATTRSALDRAREELRASIEREQAVRAELASAGGRLRRHERQVLRPEVLSDLMPARARHRRETGPDEVARRREAAHASVSDAYAAARGAEAPAGADRVEIGGL